MIVHSLGWAILHSLWQGALVFVALWIILALFPSIQAKHKYGMAFGSLMLLFGSFAIDFYQEWSQLQLSIVKITESSGSFSSSKTLLTSTLPQQHGRLDSFIASIERALPLLVVLYGLGILLMSMRLTLNLINIKRLRNQGLETPPLSVIEMMTGLMAEQDITKKIGLFISNKVDVPATIGYLKPIILLPVASVNNLSTEELEAILIHELAHIKRNDYLLNIIQTVVETILFFNPFAWLISAQIRREREYCCDDEVLSYTHYPIPYAKALANLESYRTRSLTMAAAGNGGHLLNRIKRIVEMKKQPVNYGYLGLCLLLVAGITISAICYTPSFAQRKKDEKEPKAEKITKSKVVIIDSNGKKTVYDDINGIPQDLQKEIDDKVHRSIKVMKDIDINGEDIGAEINKALSEVNWDELGPNIDKALANVDWDVIDNSINTAMNSVNWDDIDKQVQLSLEKSMKNINDPAEKDRIRAEMGKARAEIQKAKAEMAKEFSEDRRKEMHLQIAEAKVQMDSARAHIALLKNDVKPERKNGFSAYQLVQKMQADGVINKEEGYTVRKNGNELYINGALQSQAIYQKYRPYMDADKIIIKGKDDNLNIKVRK